MKAASSLSSRAFCTRLGAAFPLAAALALVGVSPAHAGGTPDCGAREGFVAVDGVRLQYLEWSGTGPTLILLHGLADDPHLFCDLGASLAPDIRVLAYARRGSGSSDVAEPYDNATLTDDLLGFMDALGVDRAALGGVSAGGNEITEFAASHAERVTQLFYIEAGYDFADPDYIASVKRRPDMEPPAYAYASLAALSAFNLANNYPALQDSARIAPLLRAKFVIQRSGKVGPRIAPTTVASLYKAFYANPPRRYRGVKAPALFLYGDSWFALDAADPGRRQAARDYDAIFGPFREASIARVRAEMPQARIIRMTGAHGNFVIHNGARLAALIRHALLR